MSVSEPTKLPQQRGSYMWHISDFGYSRIGNVDVFETTMDALNYEKDLRTRFPDRKDFYCSYHYLNDAGQPLRMDMSSHQECCPPQDKMGRPCVDGFCRFSYEWLVNDPEFWPSKTENVQCATPQSLPTSAEWLTVLD